MDSKFFVRDGFERYDREECESIEVWSPFQIDKDLNRAAIWLITDNAKARQIAQPIFDARKRQEK